MRHLDNSEEGPARSVLQGDEAFVIVGVVTVVPRTRVEESQDRARRELPRVRQADVQRNPHVPAAHKHVLAVTCTKQPTAAIH